MARAAGEAGHLCPEMLLGELNDFRRIKGYLPKVVVVHLNPQHEPEIEREVSGIAASLGIEISIAREGAEITI